MEKFTAFFLLLIAPALCFSQRAVDQLDISNNSFSIPVPSSAQADEDDSFSPDLPTTPPPQSIDIVRPDESESFRLSGVSRSAGSGSIPYLKIVLEESARQKFDPEMVLAVIKKESTFNPKAKSSVGAMGLMQLMPDTAKWLGLKDTSKLYDPATNIRYGIKYLRYLFGEFCEIPVENMDKSAAENHSVKKAIAAFNAGPGNVRKYSREPYNGIPPFKETRSYINLVTSYFLEFESMNLEKENIQPAQK